MHVSVEVDVDVGFAAAVVHAVVMGPLVVLLQYDMDRNEIFLRFVISESLSMYILDSLNLFCSGRKETLRRFVLVSYLDPEALGGSSGNTQSLIEFIIC